MTIDEAIKQLTTYSIPCGKYKDAYDMAIDTMRKYKQIEEIVNGWSRYKKGVSSSEGDSVYMQKVSEVVKDG